MQALTSLLMPILTHPAFTGLISHAAKVGITVEQLLGIALGFLIMLLFLLRTLTKSSSSLIALHPSEFRSFPLIAVEQISPDTKRLKFALQSANHVLGIPIGQHVTLRFVTSEGAEVLRSYTPISCPHGDKGFVEFVIKVYFPNVHPRFPAGGVMTMHLQVRKYANVSLPICISPCALRPLLNISKYGNIATHVICCLVKILFL